MTQFCIMILSFLCGSFVFFKKKEDSARISKSVRQREREREREIQTVWFLCVPTTYIIV